MNRKQIIDRINEERALQDQKWGFPQQASPMEWGSILAEEVGELCKELNDFQQAFIPTIKAAQMEAVKDEAIQVAAVAVSIIEHMERGKDEN